MENLKENLTEDESLKIITQMINQAKVNINQSSFHLLLWGWVISIASLSHFVLLKFTDYNHPYYAWFLIIPAFFASFIYGFQMGRKQKVSTYADRMYMWIWMSFVIVFILLAVFLQGFSGGKSAFILLFAGYATFLSGHLLKFRPLILGGISFWVFSVIVFKLGDEYGLLANALAVFIGYLIPGYSLKKKMKNGTI